MFAKKCLIFVLRKQERDFFGDFQTLWTIQLLYFFSVLLPFQKQPGYKKVFHSNIFDRERVSHGPTSLKILVVVVGTLVKFQIYWNYSKYIKNIPNKFEVFQIFYIFRAFPNILEIFQINLNYSKYFKKSRKVSKKSRKFFENIQTHGHALKAF